MALPQPPPWNLSTTDVMVLDVLVRDIQTQSGSDKGKDVTVCVIEHDDSASDSARDSELEDVSDHARAQQTLQDATMEKLSAMNLTTSKAFDPAITTNFDITPPRFLESCYAAYIRWARSIVRVETDVVFITHLLFYLCISLPSALFLYYHFTWVHGIAHVAMQFWGLGAYHSMVHQYIHANGILKRSLWAIDSTFIYITDPLFGHTWNSFYYHHTKHHHVENNGPEDLTSTLRYQRDDPWHFLQYICKFFFLTWYQLPQYFVRKNRWGLALKFCFFEAATYAMYITLAILSFRATLFVFILPHCILRPVLMIGNWGQHAFVDEVEPDSDYRSSVTTLDVLNNKLSFNEGYHTSHHLNPRRHWRDHPIDLLRHKDIYAKKGALIFQGVDYLFLAFKLITKDYKYIAEHLVPIGDQIGKTIPELEDLLRLKTRVFSEAEIEKHYPKSKVHSH